MGQGKGLSRSGAGAAAGAAKGWGRGRAEGEIPPGTTTLQPSLHGGRDQNRCGAGRHRDSGGSLYRVGVAGGVEVNEGWGDGN